MNAVGAESALQDRSTKGQVEASAAGELVLALAQRVDAVEVQARRAAPHDDVAMLETHPTRPVRARRTTPEKRCRQPEGDRNGGTFFRGKVTLLGWAKPK